MTIISYILIALVLLLFLLIIAKINVDIKYVHRNDDDELSVKVHLWNIPVYRMSAPLIKIDENSASIVVAEKQSLGGGKVDEKSGDEKKVKITFEEILDMLKEAKEFLKHVVGFHKIVRRFLNHVRV